MWLSKMGARGLGGGEPAVRIGRVSVGGEQVCVVTDGERRSLTLAAPGGLVWTPRAGAQVLVLKTDEGEYVLAGQVGGGEPESICLRAGGATLRLDADGLTVTGNLTVSGSLTVAGAADIGTTLVVAGIPYRPCTCSLA